jgi:tetratricopeptide (TPR) repeat protein/capsular polysaccharide biosynthesis protein
MENTVQWEDTVRQSQDAIALNPKDFWAYNNLGFALIKLERWEDAIRAYTHAKKLNPDVFALENNLGFIFRQLGKWEDAIVCYKSAIKLAPQEMWPYHHLGDSYLNLGQFSQAVTAYQNAIALNSNSPWSYHNLGLALFNLQRWEDAVNAYRQAIALQPNESWYYQNLGDSLSQNNQLEDALSAYQTGLNLNPNSCWFYQKIAQIFLKQEKWDDAIVFSLKSLQIKPDLDAYHITIDALKQKGETDKIDRFNPILPVKLLQDFGFLNEEQLITASSHPEITKLDIYSEKVTPLVTSQPLETGNLIFHQSEIKSNSAFVGIIPNGRVWSDVLTSAIVTSDDKLVTDLCTGSAEIVISSSQLSPVKIIDGDVAVLSVRWGGTVYFHWLFDVISRLDLLEKSGMNFEKIDYFLINRYQQSYEKEFLSILGIKPAQILESYHHPHIQAKRVIVPSVPPRGQSMITAWGCQFLKQKLCQINKYTPRSSTPTRLYLGRQNAIYRVVLNEEEVIQFLEKRGFYSVNLETMSVVEQASLIAQAEVIIAPHGSALSNLVFCERGTKIIELFSPIYVLNYYWLICNLCGLEHYHLLGEFFDDDKPLAPAEKNILVNLHQLERVMNIAEVI